MSRAIQIRVSESVVRTIHVEDGLAATLDVLPVLPPERMGDLLGAELERRGFVRSPDGSSAARTDADGLEVTVDLRAATVAVKLGAGERLAEEIELAKHVIEEGRARGEAELRAVAQHELEARVAEKTDALRRAVTARLEKKLVDLRGELDAAIGKATVAALTERAAQLGQIDSIAEDAAGNVTIKVKL